MCPYAPPPGALALMRACSSSAEALERESCVDAEPAHVAAFREYIRKGAWTSAVSQLRKLTVGAAAAVDVVDTSR